MDFEEIAYSKEVEEFRQEVRAWLEENIPSDFMVPVNRYFMTEDQMKFTRQFKCKVGEKGWLAPFWPKEYGGGGLPDDQCLVIQEEFSDWQGGRRMPTVHDQGHARGAAIVMMYGTEEQKLRFAKPVFEGKISWWQLWTESDAGSDLANVQTTAYWDGDAYVMNGHKIFMSGTGCPDLFLVLAKTDPERPRHQNLGAFVIPPDLPGITIKYMDLIVAIGRREIFLDNVRVPPEYLIGPEFEGWRVTQSALEMEHGGAGLRPPRSRLQELIVDYCKETMRDGQPVIKDSYVRDRLVEAYIHSEIARLFRQRNSWAARTGVRLSHEGSQSSLHGKVGRPLLAKVIMDIAGPYAYVTDPKWGIAEMEAENQQRQSIDTHSAATIEIQKVIMARRMGISKTKEEAAAIRIR